MMEKSALSGMNRNGWVEYIPFIPSESPFCIIRNGFKKKKTNIPAKIFWILKTYDNIENSYEKWQTFCFRKRVQIAFYSQRFAFSIIVCTRKSIALMKLYGLYIVIWYVASDLMNSLSIILILTDNLTYNYFIIFQK